VGSLTQGDEVWWRVIQDEESQGDFYILDDNAKVMRQLAQAAM